MFIRVSKAAGGDSPSIRAGNVHTRPSSTPSMRSFPAFSIAIHEHSVALSSELDMVSV
jgi:hypothetical protein